MAYQALKNRADAEDVMQTALLRLLERDTAFESEAHMRNWLIRVAINESRKILRGACRRHIFSLNEAWDPPAFDNTSVNCLTPSCTFRATTAWSSISFTTKR